MSNATEKLIQALKTKDHKDLRSALDSIYDHVVKTDAEAENLRTKVRDWNKDTEIAKLQEEVTKLRQKVVNEFTVTEDEEIEINQWIAKHAREKHNGNLNIGVSYIFSPTYLGLVKSCQCESCGASFTFQDL